MSETASGAAAALAVALGLSACAGGVAAPEAEARIQAHVDANRRYPRWADFPMEPTALPTADAVAGRISALDGRAVTLARQQAAIAWTLDDAQSFADRVAAQIAAAPVSPDVVRTRAEIDAYAEALRERGRAPPPIPRR